MADTQSINFDVHDEPKRVGWQQPIIARKRTASPSLKFRPDTDMIDALVRPRRDVLNVFSTPLFTNGEKNFRLNDKFTKASEQKLAKRKGIAKFPKTKLVEGGNANQVINLNS